MFPLATSHVTRKTKIFATVCLFVQISNNICNLALHLCLQDAMEQSLQDIFVQQKISEKTIFILIFLKTFLRFFFSAEVHLVQRLTTRNS
jgi:hypothetical protein